MTSDKQRAIDLIFANEGGYCNQPEDPGGPTNMGVTLHTLSAWRKAECTAADVQALGRDEAQAIFEAQYADPIRFDDLPAGLDYAVLDCSVNSGPSRAVRLLQSSLGFPPEQVDGVLGVHTMSAVQAVPTPDLIIDYCNSRLAYMKALRTWGTFGKGWEARVASVQAAALGLYRGAAPRELVRVSTDGQAKASGSVRVLSLASGKAAALAAAGAIITIGTSAPAIQAALEPYAGWRAVHYLLGALGVVVALAPLAVAFRRAQAGAA